MNRCFQAIAEGFVCRRQPGTPGAVAVGPRCAVTDEGGVMCTFMVQSGLGINDFQPMLARSRDGGMTWSEPVFLWPGLHDEWSLFGSVSRAPGGELFFFGTRTKRDRPGESFWSEATQGLKPNELFWAASTDGGRTWSEPVPIPIPMVGAAEAPGPMCVSARGYWIACYAPYNTFDPAVEVDRSQIVAIRSADRGQSWSHSSMLRFAEPASSGAEAWVIELADGRLLGTAWHIHPDGDRPNAYALSHDGGRSWTPTRSTGIWGQSTALAALPDGRALFVYNQRKRSGPGVWLSVARPTDLDFGAEVNQIVWEAPAPTRSGTSGAHADWQDFSFGEPSVIPLPDHTLLVVFWCILPDGPGIRFVKLKGNRTP